MVQVLQGAPDLHGDDAAAVAGRAARVGDRLYALGVAAPDLSGELAGQALFLHQATDFREELRSSGYRPDHDPQPAIIFRHRDGDAGPILARTGAELAVDGAPFAARDPNLRYQFVLLERGLVVAEDELFHRDLT